MRGMLALLGLMLLVMLAIGPFEDANGYTLTAAPSDSAAMMVSIHPAVRGNAARQAAPWIVKACWVLTALMLLGLCGLIPPGGSPGRK